MDRGTWGATIHGVAKSRSTGYTAVWWETMGTVRQSTVGVAKSRTWLSDFTFTFHFHALEKAMATHSSVRAWRIPGMGEPGGLPSMGSHSQTRLKRLSSNSSSSIVLVTQSYPTLCDPMDCSPPGSSLHGILQARILEWVAMPSSRGSSQPRDQIQVSCIAGRFFTIWTSREALLSVCCCCCCC